MTELIDMIRKHVMRDLKPYVCTYPDCSQAGETYASRFAFSHHERHIHKLRLYCVFCEKMLAWHSLPEYGRHVGFNM